jgi:hypothetical protein
MDCPWNCRQDLKQDKLRKAQSLIRIEAAHGSQVTLAKWKMAQSQLLIGLLFNTENDARKPNGA